MKPFLSDLLKNKIFSPSDVTLFHLLPDVPYFAGVYETSSSAFAKRAGVTDKTVKKFFEKLSKTGYVSMLREASSGRFAGIAFVRNDAGLHNTNYKAKIETAATGKILPLPTTQYLLYL
ncbi:MAG: hypothetical protein PHP42_08365 [Bacteroidota bacterium]|nr:hypothetical protein [Bacteroidota bacterium]